MSKKVLLGTFMPFCGFRIDSGTTNSCVDPQTLRETARKNIVRKLGEVQWNPCETVKFSDMEKQHKK